MGDPKGFLRIERAGFEKRDPKERVHDYGQYFSLPDDATLRELSVRLARLDARPTGPWTRDILEWIRANPHVVSKELAALRAVELLPMKVDIRKLKALGLTISHDVGYELSPRGAAYLDWLGRGAP